MRRTIGIVGLTTISNAGDELLVEAAKFLVRSHDPDIVLVDIDVDPRTPEIRAGRRALNFRAAETLRAFEGPLLGLFRSDRARYLHNSAYWRIKLGWYMRERLRGLDAIIFAGGGFIKFKTQGLNYLDEIILDIAREQSIPVMMNAVGVEGYSETDFRCQRLKRVLNYPNVRVITTRDDIDTLNEKYIVNPGTVTARVGDPVFWLREMDLVAPQPEPRAARSGHRIGINLINPDNFSVYGGRVSRSEIINFYRSLIIELQRLEADFSLFSNGMRVDQEFGSSLVESLRLDPERLLPAPRDSADFVQQVAGFDIILSGRMHAGITAYALDVPVLGLIWGEKLKFLTRITGLDDRFFREDQLDHRRIAERLVANDLPAPDLDIRDELRERTRRHLADFIDGVYAKENTHAAQAH